MKFKVEKSGRGAGILSLEEGTANDKPVAMLVFRNKFGSVMFQGQIMKNVSKFTKRTPAKPQKIQRMLTVIGKKEGGGHGLIKCTITFKDESDCAKFRETFVKVVAGLPEIVKPGAGAAPKAETKKEAEPEAKKVEPEAKKESADKK